MKTFKRLTAMLLTVLILSAITAPLELSAASSKQIYYNIDMSADVLKSRIQQQVSSDCAVVSMATIEAYMHGATTSADKTTVYNAVVNKNTDDNYAYWGNCGYVAATIDWTAVYNQLAKGYPCIIHRPATSTKSQHWAVVAGYKGSTTTLETGKFVVVDVYHGTGGTDIYTSSAWANGTTIDRMAYRKNGIAVTTLSSGIRFAINHPSLVHKSGQGHGVYGNIVSNVNLTNVQISVTNLTTGKVVFSKTVTPNAKSYLMYNLDSSMTFASWPAGEYYYCIVAYSSAGSNTYVRYFQIGSEYPTTDPTPRFFYSFDANGGTGLMPFMTLKINEKKDIPANRFTRSGYTLSGWNCKRSDGKWIASDGHFYTESELQAKGLQKKFYPNESFTYFHVNAWWLREATTPITGVTAYAVWESNKAITTYTVTLTDNGDGTANITAVVPAGIASGKLVIDVSDKLSYISGSLDSVYGAIANENYNGDMLCISFSGINALDKGTVIFTANFKVNGNAQLSVNDFTAPEWNLTDGSVKLSSQADGDVIKVFEDRSYELGDVNGDGSVDNLDSVTILKYDAGIIGDDALNLLSADVDGDGSVDNLDSVLILKYDAGIIPDFGR